jgi:uncharacterized membrane protein
MKISLSAKLGIGVVLLFSAVITTCLLWTPEFPKTFASPYAGLVLGLPAALLIISFGLWRWWASMSMLIVVAILNYGWVTGIWRSPVWTGADPKLVNKFAYAYLVNMNLPIISAYVFIAFFYLLRSIYGKKPLSIESGLVNDKKKTPVEIDADK